MDRQLIAIRDGKYDEAIKLAEDCLRDKPNDIGSHFTLAQAYESTGATEKALEHATICESLLPSSFDALSIAARCASKLERYDEAYSFADKALKDRRDPNLPAAAKFLFRLLSFVPGLKTLRYANDSVVNAYSRQTQWLHEYVTWYEKQSPDKRNPSLH